MARSIRRSSKTLSPERVRELQRLAERIDREEAPEIRRRGRMVKARLDALRDVVAALKAERLRLGLSLTEVGRRSGIGKANLSRLENERDPNPTIDTLMRYAAALDREIRIDLGATPPSRRSA